MNTAQKSFKTEDFRDQSGTMDKEGNRKWVYARKVKGNYYNKRTYLSWFLIGFYLIAPFIKINDNPFLKFDLLRREFFVFSFVFYPQDYFLFAIGTILTFVFIILFTVVYGRIFCGWLCPQTIFLEMVFRKIEFAIEGDRGAQMRLDKEKWTSKKIQKKALKWSIFGLISLVMSHVLFAYFIGADRLFEAIQEGFIKHWGVFVLVFGNAGVIYFVYAWFREQACTLVCPYGRFQGVLVDKDTIAVTYDYKRGEGQIGRAKFRKGEDRKKEGKGDCIDCKQCVAVCPTGIDIRNGTQLECVNCTACMDACDEVMDKVNLPLGLIRYASENNIAKGTKTKFTPRMFAYSVVLLALIGSLGVLLAFRSPVESKFLSPVGATYIVVEKNILNTYEYTLLNKSAKDFKIHFELLSFPGKIILPNKKKYIELKKGEKLKGRLKVIINENQIQKPKTSLKIGIYDEKNNLIDSYTSSFLGPFKL